MRAEQEPLARRDLMVIGAILFAGAALRLGAYLANRSVWQDEAALIMSILRRTPAGMLEPLERGQVAPPGFLFVEKLAVTLLGESEYALRLFPLLCSILSLFLFLLLLRRFVRGAAVPIGLALFALAPMLLNWAADVKQYSTDVFVGLALTLLALQMRDSSRRRMRDAVMWGSIGAAGVWLSHPAVFVLAGTGGVVLLDALKRREHELMQSVLVASVVWIAGFAALFALTLSSTLGNQGIMMDWWAPYFMPMPPRSLDDTLWPYHAFNWFMGSMVRLTFLGSTVEKIVVVIILLAGVKELCRTATVGLALLAAPVIVALAASAMRLYPFGGRLALYLVPTVLILMAAGLGSARKRAAKVSRVLAVAVVALPLSAAAMQAYAIHPWTERSEIKANLLYLVASREAGDAAYVYSKSIPALEYYSRVWSLAEDGWIRGRADFDEEEELAKEYRLLPAGRVWMLFSDQDDTEAEIRRRVEWAGRIVAMHRAEGSLLFLIEVPDEREESP